MTLHAVRPTGHEYLALVTDLLQRQRLADPVAGLWEAADLQWWYTRDPHPHDADAVVWVDGHAPVTAAVFTRWSAGRYGCEVIGDPTLAAAWEFVHRRCAELPTASIEMEVDATSPVSAAEAVRAGFTERVETIAVSWLDAADRAAVRALPDGYTLVARPEQDGPHPMIKRNGAHVEARLRDCSLYDPELDLALLTDDGAVAGYAMFWADPALRRTRRTHAYRGHAQRARARRHPAARRWTLARRCDRFKSATKSPIRPRRGIPHSSARRGVPTHDRPHRKVKDSSASVVRQSARTPTNKSRCASAGHPGRVRESHPGAVRAANGTRAVRRRRSCLQEPPHAPP